MSQHAIRYLTGSGTTKMYLLFVSFAICTVLAQGLCGQVQVLLYSSHWVVLYFVINHFHTSWETDVIVCFFSIWDLDGDHKGFLYKSYRADTITRIGDILSAPWQFLTDFHVLSRKFPGMLVSTGGSPTWWRSQPKIIFFSMVFKYVAILSLMLKIHMSSGSFMVNDKLNIDYIYIFVSNI